MLCHDNNKIEFLILFIQIKKNILQFQHVCGSLLEGLR